MFRTIALLLLSFTLTGCPLFNSDSKSDEVKSGRAVMIIGVDISGSYKNSSYYKDSMNFIAHYIFAHLKGLKGMDVPDQLFVGSIGGAKPNQPKTFFPIEAFQYKSIDQILAKLNEIFPAHDTNQFTDFNAFFEQISTLVQNRKLVMRPISIILLSDGKPDTPKVDGKRDFRSFNFEGLETLSRNVTIRLLYTDAETGDSWQTKIPRKRVRVWTQDATVMKDWNDKDIVLAGKAFEEQDRLFDWIKNNVDFQVRVTRID